MLGYLRKVWKVRFFWITLVRNDLRNRYRRSIIGVGWSLLHPIAMTAVLCGVFARLLGSDLATYAPYLLAGLVTWNYIVAVMNQGCQCFFVAESYIRQHPAPLAIYPLRTALGAGIHFLIGLAVVLVFTWCLRGFGNLPALVGLLPAVLLLFVIGCSLAVCMGVVNVLFQDSQHLTEILLQILFYATPIIYPAEMLRERGLATLVAINPLAALLDLVREPVINGRLPSLQAVGVGTAAAALAAAAAVAILWRFERRLIFYL
ncbi:MAG: ABC transporter permease [Thermoguttaceae bacterium]